MWRLPVLGLVVGILACGDDNGTGPTFANVNGSWSLSITGMTGGGAQCGTTSPIQLTFQQSTTTFTGTYSGGGVLTCTAPFGSFSAATGSGSVIDGEISRNEVSFDLDSANFHHTGTVAGSSMTGTAIWTFVEGSASTLGALTGSWTATK
ncbi:MAG TPA: hypothetical protein VFZ87_08865, partial [Gemmatimonadales bacterium]